MGVKTLPQFEEDLQLALGNRGFTTDQLDNWINTGLLDLTSQHEFEELDSPIVETILANANNFTPIEIEGILELTNLTHKISMTRIEQPRWSRLDQTVTGEPKHWYRRANIIYVWPTPIEDVDVTGDKLGTHPPLTGTDSTVLQSMWDRAVHLLAMFHALSDLEEPSRAVYFADTASRYIKKRIDLLDVDGRSTGMPVQPIESFAQLRRQREFDRTGGRDI